MMERAEDNIWRIVSFQDLYSRGRNKLYDFVSRISIRLDRFKRFFKAVVEGLMEQRSMFSLDHSRFRRDALPLMETGRVPREFHTRKHAGWKDVALFITAFHKSMFTVYLRL